MKLLITILLFFLLTLSFPFQALAVEDPLSHPNNKYGIHILFPTELDQAAKLVNTNGGEWGYVTIPIQATDRDIDKWQSFMDECRKLKIILIIRIATYPYTDYWIRPTEYDPVDFANFLDSLNWPVKNRYIIIYNEPNHGQEYGSEVDAANYAQSLSEAIDIFKKVSQDFFIISAGLDPHAPNSGTAHENSYKFLNDMDHAVPGIFQKIDGFSSHPYPGGDFSADPSKEKYGGINTFREEEQFLSSRFDRHNIPIFITETGWKQQNLSEDTIAQYYQYAFTNIFIDQNIVAVTPFLLNGVSSGFTDFSFVKADGSVTKSYTTISSIPKTKGDPDQNAAPIVKTITSLKDIPTKILSGNDVGQLVYNLSPTMKDILKWLVL